MKNLLDNWIYNTIINILVGILFIYIAMNKQVWWMVIFGLFFLSIALFKMGYAFKNRTIQVHKEKKKH